MSSVADELELERAALTSLIELLETELETSNQTPLADALARWHPLHAWHIRRPLERTLGIRLLTAARSYRGTIEHVAGK